MAITYIHRFRARCTRLFLAGLVELFLETIAAWRCGMQRHGTVKPYGPHHDGMRHALQVDSVRPSIPSNSRPNDALLMPAPENGHQGRSSQREPYWFKTKAGTDLATFEAYIIKLPDGGAGDQIVFSHLPWQTYITHLTPEEAGEVEKQPFVKFVWPLARESRT